MLGNRRFCNERLSESTMKQFGYKKNTNKTQFYLFRSLTLFFLFELLLSPPWPFSPLELVYLTTKMLQNHLERAKWEIIICKRAIRNWSDMIRVYSFTWRSNNCSGCSLNITSGAMCRFVTPLICFTICLTLHLQHLFKIYIYCIYCIFCCTVPSNTYSTTYTVWVCQK